MRKIISFMHISLDGFVAGPNGEMNWIKVDQEIFDHVEQRIGATDTALYGRVTYEMMEHYWPTADQQPNASKHDKVHAAWYRQANKIVLSRSMKNMERPNTTIISDDLVKHIQAIQQSEGSEIAVFGSPTATHALMQHNLIDGFWLFLNPTLLGAGIPLFKDIKEKINLKLLPETRQFKCGVTELNYLVDRG